MENVLRNRVEFVAVVENYIRITTKEELDFYHKSFHPLQQKPAGGFFLKRRPPFYSASTAPSIHLIL